MSETKSQETARLKSEAIDYLRTLFPKGSTVTTVVLHVSGSGMQRAIAVLATGSEARTPIWNVSWAVARAMDSRLHPKRDGVKVDGAGMDMAFALTYNLAAVLHGDGYALHQNTI